MYSVSILYLVHVGYMLLYLKSRLCLNKMCNYSGVDVQFICI